MPLRFSISASLRRLALGILFIPRYRISSFNPKTTTTTTTTTTTITTTTTTNMSFSTSTTFAQKWLTPSFTQSLHDFWFRKLSPNDIIPNEDCVNFWFFRADNIDQLCRETYIHFLEDVQNTKPSPHDLLPDPYANPSTTLTTIILLDQIPRNVFRGSEAKIVFNIFDPLALDIALRSIFPKTYQHAMKQISSADTAGDKGSQVPWYQTEAAVLQDEDESQGVDNLPEFRYNFGRRMWFYMPLVHSESLKIHNWLDKRYKAMIADIEDLSDDVSNEVKEACRVTLKKFYQAELDHKQLIERFGRYPHRNKPLGRESTQEETDYLENGGLTFGSTA